MPCRPCMLCGGLAAGPVRRAGGLQVAEAAQWRPDSAFQKTASGTHWDIPYALGQAARAGTDARGAACSVYDVALHPQTCRRADKDARFQVAWPSADFC